MSQNDRPDSELNYLERVQKYRDTLPEEVHGVYQTLLGEGRAPHIAAAIVSYCLGLTVSPRKTQSEVADEYGTTESTIMDYYRDVLPAVADALDVDPPVPDASRGGEVPRRHLLYDLRRVADILGHSPTVAEYDEHGKHSVGTLSSHFDTFNKAKEAAGLETYKGLRATVHRNALISDLQRVADVLGHSPTVDEYDEHGEHSPKTIQSKFKTFNKAKEEAGLKLYHGGVHRDYGGHHAGVTSRTPTEDETDPDE